ncbi:MAG: SpoIIE family protein phosphatase [Magnetococcus sp. YQC-3]
MEHDLPPEDVAACQAKIQQLEKKCAYFQAQANELAGTNIRNDAALSSTRLQLKQKEQAFQLLSRLQTTSGVQNDVSQIVSRTLETLQAQMQMSRSILFLPDKEDISRMVPRFWLGYPGDEAQQLHGQLFPVTEKMTQLGDFILSTKEQPVPGVTELFAQRFGVRFFVCVPVVLQNRISGVLLTSRTKEAKPFHPTLNIGDVETLKSIASFLAMSLENRDLYANLEQKVAERTLELFEKSDALEKAQTLIHESLRYASNLQLAILPDEALQKIYFADFFAIWEPMSIVGGDIYFIQPTSAGCLLFVIDCTGHGIPGAFMTMIAGAALESISTGKMLDDPGHILMEFDRFVTCTLQQHKEGAKSDNGMDMSICLITPGRSTLVYAGAKLNLYRVRNQECATIKGDRRSVGYRGSYTEQPFTNHIIDIQAEDTFYLCSDGYQDQVGGPKKIPFGMRRMLQLLNETSSQPFTHQKEILLNELLAYQGSEKRRDDLTLIGFRCQVSSI